MLLPLRIFLPLILLAFVLLINGYTQWVAIPEAQIQSDQRTEAYVSETLNRLQGTLRYLFERGDRPGVSREVSNLGGLQGFDLLVLLDENGRVLASNRYATLGRDLATLSGDVNIDAALVRRVQSSMVSIRRWSADRQRLTAYYPVPIGATAASIRPDRIGALYVEFSAVQRKSRITGALLTQVNQVSLFTGGLLVLLLIFLHFAVTRRAARLVESSGRLSGGELGVRVGLGGRDEIAKIGQAFDNMATRLEHEQQRLKDSEQRTRAILNNVTDAIISINKRGEVQSFNQAAESLFGYRADEVLGRNVNMLMPNPHRDQHDTYLTNYLTTHVPKIIANAREVDALRADGERVPVELTVTGIELAGEPMFIGLLRDLREHRKIERMKTEFVSVVSHELRTPLTSIRGSLGLLGGNVAGELGDQARSLIAIADSNVERLTRLINDLLDIQKIEAGKMVFEFRVMPLPQLIDEAIAANRHFASQLTVNLAIPQPVPDVMVNVDPVRFQQVMANFISNACKYSPAQGTVEILVDQSESHGVTIYVRDHGPGVPDAFREYIFQKFCQADASSTRAKDGTGLGLAITKELVTRMGGEVGFDTVPGQGTTFYFSLPLADPAAV